MKQDVFPIENGGNSIAMLVYQRVAVSLLSCLYIYLSVFSFIYSFINYEIYVSRYQCGKVENQPLDKMMEFCNQTLGIL